MENHLLLFLSRQTEEQRKSELKNGTMVAAYCEAYVRMSLLPGNLERTE